MDGHGQSRIVSSAESYAKKCSERNEADACGEALGADTPWPRFPGVLPEVLTMRDGVPCFPSRHHRYPGST